MNPPTFQTRDTIVAVSSPPGRAYRGLIRLSGEQSRDILKGLLARTDSLGLSGVMTPVRLADPSVPAMACLYVAPHSYTGQDMVELQVPGHPALLDRLVHRAIETGARLAEPGEFTFRAFVGGKMDLTEAEGVAATIHAASDGQLRAAAHLRHGELARLSRELVDDLGSCLALVEAGIDFTDQEDVVPISASNLDRRLAELVHRLGQLLANSRSWGEVESLPKVVLVGPPSAGKSTLFNALLGKERAVIDPMPGTTRDVLSEPLKLTDAQGVDREVMLVDIAGLDPANVSPRHMLDEEAQTLARRAIEQADLLIRVLDPTTPDTRILALPPNIPTIEVLTKADLIGHETNTTTEKQEVLAVSAVTGTNLDRLRLVLMDQLGKQAVSVSGEVLALQPRHERSLSVGKELLEEARHALAGSTDRQAIGDVELVADLLRQALDELAALGGELTPDDVIGKVFATFCVGK